MKRLLSTIAIGIAIVVMIGAITSTGQLGGQGGGMWLLPDPTRAAIENQARDMRLQIETERAQQSASIKNAMESAWQPVAFVGNLALAIIAIGTLAGCGVALVVWGNRRAAEVRANAAGLFPVLCFNVGGVKLIHDPNKSPTATTLYSPVNLSQSISVVPVMAESPIQAGMALAGANIQAIAAAHRWPQLARPMAATLPAQQLSAPADISAEISWPDHIDLAGLLAGGASLTNLIIGVMVNERGQITPVTASLYELMHVLLVGASGWGKSTWLRSFLYQVAISAEMSHVVAIDISGSEFNALQSWPRLRYPVARDQQSAVALLAEVRQEITRRKALYQAHPLATRLDEYNRLASEPLAPWIVAVDEGTALMNEPGIGEPMRAGVQTARQYGVYFLVAGQNANANVMSTQTRDQFSSRFCFHTSPRSSQVVIDRRDAANLDRPGMAYAQLPGRPLAQILAPEISREQFATVLAGDGPQYDMPAPAGDVSTGDDVAGRVMAMYAKGASMRQIEQKIFGYTGGKAHQTVKEILSATTTTGQTRLG